MKMGYLMGVIYMMIRWSHYGNANESCYESLNFLNGRFKSNTCNIRTAVSAIMNNHTAVFLTQLGVAEVSGMASNQCYTLLSVFCISTDVCQKEHSAWSTTIIFGI